MTYSARAVQIGAIWVALLTPLAVDASEGGELADQPLFLGGGVGVPGNLVLVPSIEFPTVESVANIEPEEVYSSEFEFVGYFDPEKCYEYSYSSTESERHFFPVNENGPVCTGEGEWSGNYLNWAATPTVDPFRKALTGGYRAKDTPSETRLEKARSAGQGSASNFPRREVPDSLVAGATPFTASSFHTRIFGLGNRMRFRLDDDDVDHNVEEYDPDNSDMSRDGGYDLRVRVKVCDPSVGVEANCEEYDSGWKPEGAIQKNAKRLRYSVIGYLSDSNYDENNRLRDGGVLRARQKYVGPEKLVAGEGNVDNPEKEWDPDTGVFVQNPNPDDAQDTAPDIEHSGVINYINKAGQVVDDGYKVYDPVSELYYAATRYLKNQGNVAAYSDMSGASNRERQKLRDGFPVIEDWDDPIIYECQANVLLGIGDANTSRDKNLPGSTYTNEEPATPPEVAADDTVDVVEETNRIGAMEGVGDIGNRSNFSFAANSAYIAGLAYHNLTRDMRPDIEDRKVTAATHWVDVREGGVLEPPRSNQYYLAAKFGGFEVSDDVDFDPETWSDDLPEDWWHTNGDILRAHDGERFPRPDNYYLAGEAAAMIESLEEAFDQALEEVEGSSTGITFNTATLETDTLLFEARFDSSRWSGQLFARGLTENPGGAPEVQEAVEWDAAAVLDERDLEANPRQIITYNEDTAAGVPFLWNNLSGHQRNDLQTGDVSVERAEERIDFLRGDMEIEDMRTRTSRLGDIVNSTPVYVQNAGMGWPNGGEFGEDGNRYVSFQNDQLNRRPVVYSGANDGMLHAFAAGEDEGDELFGYIPGFLYSDEEDQGLHFLTEPSYEHRYYVDLSPVVSDVFVKGADGEDEDWRTVLIGGARAGAKGLFALDVTDPESIEEDDAAGLPLWEFTAEHDDNLGYITEPPVIGMAQWGSNDYRWTAFFGNGYNADSDSTGFFMVDLNGGRDGNWSDSGGQANYQYIEFEGGGSGLSPVRALDQSGDSVIDRIYAGDRDGNLWVADAGNNGSWGTSYGNDNNPDPLFSAPNNQPITAAPMVVRNPDEGGSDPNLLVLFGTGQYLTENDPLTTDVQSFYGVQDTGASGLDRGSLEPRSLSEDTIVADGIEYEVRTSEGNDLGSGRRGWYVDFNTDEGERIVLSPQVRGEYVFINSMVPTQDICGGGGDGWLMAFGLDGRTPERKVFTSFDEAVVGYRTEGGIPESSGFLGDYMLTPRSDGDIVGDELDIGRDEDGMGRMGWQELIE